MMTSSATKIMVALLGAVTAVAGTGHGTGEVLQGNVAPPGTARAV